MHRLENVKKNDYFSETFAVMYNLNIYNLGVYEIACTRFDIDIKQFYDILLTHTHTGHNKNERRHTLETF